MSLFSSVSSSTGSSPLKPGCPVAVKLSKVEISKINEEGKGQDGNLVVSFKGTDMSNAGTSRFTFWLSNFDTTSPKYNEKSAENTLAQIKQLYEAFATSAEIEAAITAQDVKTAFAQVAALLSTKVGATATMKIVYKKGSDEEVVLPNFGDFINTELAPRGLVLSSKAGSDNIPYDRVKPLSEYGVVAGATNAMPGATGGLPASAPAAFQAPTQAPAAFTPPAQAATPAFAPAAPASNVI